VKYVTDNTVFYIDPEDINQPVTAAARLLTGGSCNYAVYDTAKETVVDEDLASFATVIKVASTAPFAVGEAVEVEHTGGQSFTRETIASIQDGVSLTLNNGLSISGAIAGQRVRKVLGASPYFFNMPAYGTAKVDDKTWGYSGQIQSGFFGLLIDMEVEIVIRFLFGGIREWTVLCETITEGCDT
jgi:hypothetical protein